MNQPAPPPGGLGGAPPGGPVGYYTPPAAATGGRPAVILWYRVYAISSLIAYAFFGLAIGGFTLGASTAEALMMAAVMLPFVLISGIGAFVPFKPWGWTFGLVTIALGVFSCLAPFSIILIIFWNRPETKAAFQRL